MSRSPTCEESSMRLFRDAVVALRREILLGVLCSLDCLCASGELFY
jgi:hypothetical protein